jgi:hypothetical protein
MMLTMPDAASASFAECRKFDEYSFIICDYEVMRLLNFRDALNKSSDSQGYIIVYGGQGERRGEAEAHAARLKDAFVHSLGISPERFTVIVGGYREKWAVELWLCPRDAAKPAPSPTIKFKDIRFRKGKINKAEYKWCADCC